MRAMVVEEFGAPEVLTVRDVPDPVPGPGQVLIDVAVADVLFLDTALRAGAGQDWFPLRPPYVPGTGAAGTVRAVGFGVDPALVGHRVVASTGQSGGYAEQVVVDVAAVVPVPRRRDLVSAAAILHDGLTALALADASRVSADSSVLVVGASGGLGISLVQLAVARGARVTATARDWKVARLRDLGATVVDSGDSGWPAAVGGGFDVVLDNVGGELGRAAFDLVADGGVFSAHGAPSGDFTEITPERARARSVRVLTIADVQLAPVEEHRLAVAALDDPALRPVVGQTYPLEKAADAHRAIAERTVFGKTLLTVAQS